jgi:hypothetical protein
MKSRRFPVSFVAVVIFTMITVASVTAYDPAPEPMLQLVQQIETLTKQIADLQAKIKILTDALEDIRTLAMDKTDAQQATVTEKPTLRSPRQIDRPPIGDEKIAIYTAKVKVEIEDENLESILVDLLTSKNMSDFACALRSQLQTWLDTPSKDRQFSSPLSPKQTAWAAHLTNPAKYPNPKKDPDFYGITY